MYRLINSKSLYQYRFNNTYFSSNNSFGNVSNREIKCSFCRKFILGHPSTENIALIRHQSTRTASVLKSLRKKAKYKNYKKYGELLEIRNKNMTETKVSISKLKPAHLSELTSSTISLGQLHQLSNIPPKKSDIQIDPELLQTVKEKILKKPPTSIEVKDIKMEDDKCALVYTTHNMLDKDMMKTKQFIDIVKQSYYNFRKATIYDQRLKDLKYAISEGLHQEFDLDKFDNPELKSPHAVFKELFFDSQLDSYDQELMSHISNLQYSSQGISHSTLHDIYEDPLLHNELADEKEVDDLEQVIQTKIKNLNIKKAKQATKQKKKARKQKSQALQEINMKQDMKELKLRGKQQWLHRTLTAHLQLLWSLNMLSEGRQVLQYYRHKSEKNAECPKINDVNVYNTLLHGYASQGQLENMKELLSYMAADKVPLNPQTYAAIFECIEKSDRHDKIVLLEYFYRRMQEENINLNDLMDKTKFLYDQREVVLRAIRRLEPQFVPQYMFPLLDYECQLLDNLKLENVENRIGLTKSPAEGLVTVEEMIKLGKEQLEIELKGEIEVENIATTDEPTKEVKYFRQKLKETEDEWRTVIKEAFIRNLSSLKAQSNASHTAITLYPYLKVLEVNQIVNLIMGEITKLVDGSETYSPALKLLQRDLGTQVYHKYQIEQCRRNGVLKKIEHIYEQYCKWYVERKSPDGSDRPYNGRQVWQILVHQNRDGASLDTEETPWPMEIRQNIGKFLYNIIINDVKIDVNMFKPKAKQRRLPGVYKVHRPWARSVRLELKPHPALARLWATAARRALPVRAPLLPLPAAPPPWTRPRAHAGPYLVTHAPLIRVPHYVMNQWNRIENAPAASMYPVLDSLNQLGEVPWVINKPILDLQLKVFRSGGNKKLDIPPPASSLDTSQFALPEEKNAAATFRRRVLINRARAEMHSLWCDALYKLSLANHYRERVFWLPHNMDFRGRVYACPPHVTQLGADAARALLQFGRARPLGPKGLRWLKLHAINLTGTLKGATLQERLDYANSLMDKILDSADRPLDGEGWWMQSEEPWQTLACCMEIANAVRSPNPEEYECSFPVHQDGSCNGLQHYAALGGDAAGAAAVNLAPAHRPQDVYTAVANMVEQMRVRDAAAGVLAAQVLENFVRRKVIKQTVMTTVYGVTKFGARLQIAKQLKDIDDFPKEHVWMCSNYLTARTFDSLGEMFTSTKLIQDWFTDCAKVISGVCGESVEWVTPLGLPVVQPYYRRHSPPAGQAAPLDHMQRPCTMKQRNAFPPNFIHSLDSSHMMLTGLHCQAAGLAFVSVHDCFWTHPHTVDTMNRICREQFVALHSQPILKDLSDYLVKRYSYAESELEDGNVGASNRRRVNKLLEKVPTKGDFDLNGVLQSVYFFS